MRVCLFLRLTLRGAFRMAPVFVAHPSLHCALVAGAHRLRVQLAQAVLWLPGLPSTVVC